MMKNKIFLIRFLSSVFMFLLFLIGAVIGVMTGTVLGGVVAVICTIAFLIWLVLFLE